MPRLNRPGGLGIVAVWLAAPVAALIVGAALAMDTKVAWIAVAVVMAIGLYCLLGDYSYPILLGFVALSPIAFPFLRVPPYVTFDRVLLLGAGAGIILKPYVLGRTRATRLFTAALLWLLVAFGLRAGAQNLSAMQAWVDAILLPTIAFVLVGNVALTARRCRQIGAAMTFAGAALGIIGLAGYAFGFELASRVGGGLRTTFETSGQIVTRISGPYAAPEVFALALVVCFAATLYWILVTRTPLTYTLGIAAAMLELTALGLTLFRAAWIAALIVLIVTFGLRPRRFARAIGVTMAIGALALAGTTTLSSNQTFETRLKNTDNIEGRLATYVEAVNVFKSAPAFGVGINRYSLVVPGFETVVVAGVAAVPFPHSSYFGMLAEQGLFGFLPFLALTIAVWYMLRAFRRRARSRHDVVLAAAAIGATLGYLLMSLTLTMLPYGPSNVFFVLFLGMVAARLDTVSMESEPASA
jgi:O-antigen ligase